MDSQSKDRPWGYVITCPVGHTQVRQLYGTEQLIHKNNWSPFITKLTSLVKIAHHTLKFVKVAYYGDDKRKFLDVVTYNEDNIVLYSTEIIGDIDITNLYLAVLKRNMKVGIQMAAIPDDNTDIVAMKHGILESINDW